VLAVDQKDLRRFPLAERKRLMRSIVPMGGRSVLYADHIDGRGRELFAAVFAQDLEGIVAKRKDGRYEAGSITTWTKIKNPAYSQAVDRHELFERSS
jgi:ATP-dependent DNA ligase